MNAQDFIDQFGGEYAAGHVIAKVNGKQRYVFQNGQITEWGLTLIETVMAQQEAEKQEEREERVRPVGKRKRKAYQPDEDDYELS